MQTSKLLPVGFLALALTGTGALIATAQTPPADTEASQAQAQVPVQRTDVRNSRDGHRRDRGSGRRGGSEMFLNLFNEVNANGDGSVTQAEIDSYRATKVGEADASGDGALSIEEFDTLYREFTRSRMVDTFQDFDADGDGVISAEEMDARLGGIVDRLDRDNDGELTIQDRGRRG